MLILTVLFRPSVDINQQSYARKTAYKNHYSKNNE
jgi:hypothetical protein